MKTAIVYVSVHNGNTHKVASVMADELGADLFTVTEARNVDLSGYDLIGFGSGIYFQQHHTSLLKLIDTLPVMDCAKCFIFSTSGAPELFFNRYSTTITEKLTKKGFIIKGAFSCRGCDNTGAFRFLNNFNREHPTVRDLEKARQFAKGILTEHT